MITMNESIMIKKLISRHGVHFTSPIASCLAEIVMCCLPSDRGLTVAVKSVRQAKKVKSSQVFVHWHCCLESLLLMKCLDLT